MLDPILNIRAVVRIALEALPVRFSSMSAEERRALRTYVVHFVGQHALPQGVLLDPDQILTELEQELAAQSRRCT